MTVVRGIVPAMFTTWDSSDEYDQSRSEKYVDWLLESGVDGIAVTGSTGEMTAMSLEDQKKVIQHVTRYVSGQVPVLASVGKYSTHETLELAHAAKAAGADALMVLLPYYYKPYKEAALRHLKIVHDEVGLPISLYNNPHFAGYEFTPREVAEMYADGIVDSIKAAQGDSNRIADLKAICDITTFYGHDYAPLGAFAAGADGWLSGFPAAFAKQCRELMVAVRDEQDLEKGRQIWKKWVPFVEFFMDPAVNAEMHWLEVLKFAVEYQGVDVGLPRRPLTSLDKNQKARITPLLDQLLG